MRAIVHNDDFVPTLVIALRFQSIQQKNNAFGVVEHRDNDGDKGLEFFDHYSGTPTDPEIVILTIVLERPLFHLYRLDERNGEVPGSNAATSQVGNETNVTRLDEA